MNVKLHAINHNLQGFTLVELIVVIVILAVLGTIGFLSYTGYLVGARDSSRIEQLQDIANGLNVYGAKTSLPFPDKYITIKVNGNVIAYQGYMGQSQLDSINYSKGGKDPKDQEYFTYYLSADKKYFQLLGFLEDPSSQIAEIFSQVYAADYTSRYITTIGKKLGVLTEAVTNQPIQAVSAIASSGTLDIATTTSSYTAWLSDKTSVQGTGTVLQATARNASCKRIKESGLANTGNGMYSVNLTGTGTASMYCNMTDGWMLVDPNCDLDNVTIGTQVWAGCNSTLGNGIEWGGTNCYNYAGVTTTTDCTNVTYMASNKKEKNWSVATSVNGTQNAIWGKLYTWTGASSACSTGWHLPSETEWATLEQTLNSGIACRTINDWQCSGLGWLNNQNRTSTNNIVQALHIPLSGYRELDGTFYYRGRDSFLWSSTIAGSSNVYYRRLYSSRDTISRDSASQMFDYNVRCLKN